MPPDDVRHPIDVTNSNLLQRMRDRDGGAWQQFAELYGPIVRYWIRRSGLEDNDLADVFQEVFLAVSTNVGKFERQEGKAKFRAWLKTVTHSKLADFHRRRKSQPVGAGGTTAMRRIEEAADSHEGAVNDVSAIAPSTGAASAGNTATERNAATEGNQADDLAHSESTFLTQRALRLIRSEFQEQTWQAFWRTTIDGRTSQEVADELKMNSAAVRKAKSRVMARLRKLLEEIGVDGDDTKGDDDTGSNDDQ